MKNYKVTIQKVYKQTVEIQNAQSHEDAINKAFDGEGKELGPMIFDGILDDPTLADSEEA